MNKKELYQRMLELHSASPRSFRVHGYLRDEFPKLCAKLKSDFDVEQLGWEHVFRYCHPKVSGKCGTCQKPTAFISDQRKFRDYCSLSCMQNSPEVRAKKEATNLKRRGTKWPTQSKEVRDKVEATNLKRFGVKHPAQSQTCQKKARKTNLRKYGVEHGMQNPEVRAKVVATNLAKSGGKYTTPFQDPKSMRKARRTMTERYGAPHSGQVPELFAKGQKSRYTHYDVTLGGMGFRVQGYEDMALRLLLKWGVPTKKIRCGRFDRFIYRAGGTKHSYYPDFYLSHGKQRVYVEVKSLYTAGLRTGELDSVIRAKGKAVVAEGRPFLLLVLRTKDQRSALRGNRVGWITHFMFSTPKRPDWKLYSKKSDKEQLKARIQAWLAS
jgi:hypothetical protein